MKLAVDSGERSGKLVAELENVTKRFDGRAVVRDVSLRIMRGDRIGVIGPNGAGKTTLLKLIIGEMEPDEGRIRRGTKLQVAYFDQMRAQLDPERTLADTISPGSEWIETANGRKHVLSYLGDFLFAPQRAAAPVKMLSGGERNRLLLARLFALPANLLVLDEPTNDLDIESLELLEQTLQSYAGTLLLVSHDRTFLDNVVTQTVAAESSAGARGDVEGIRRRVQRLAFAAAGQRRRRRASMKVAADPGAAPAAPATSPQAIVQGAARARSAAHRAGGAGKRADRPFGRMASAGYHTQGADAIRRDRARAAEIERELADKFERWAALDARVSAQS